LSEYQTKSETRSEGGASNVRLLFLSLRPWEWIKNLLVLAPLFFAGIMTEPGLLQNAIGGFLQFCFMASAVYLFNDLADRKNDRLHPAKAQRPLASGELSPSLAWGFCGGLSLISLGSAFIISKSFFMVLCAYAIINIFYTLWLKQVIILDVMVIALGFVLRVIGGSVLVGVQPSNWIVMCTILLSLFLALSKRRYELQTIEGEPGLHREVLKGYNAYILDQLIAVVTASTVMSYALYAITVGDFQIYSVFFVLFGIFRYLYLLHGGAVQGTPTEMLLADRPLLFTLLLWGLFLMVDIYFL